MAKQRICAHCGKPIGRDMSPRAKYCSDSCRVLACRKRRAKGVKPEPQPKAKPTPVLNQREFDRMMDGSMEDELRHVRDRLKAYVDDPSTPANAMPNIVAKYLAVCEKLHSLSGGDPLAGLLEETEVTGDVGASVV